MMEEQRIQVILASIQRVMNELNDITEPENQALITESVWVARDGDFAVQKEFILKALQVIAKYPRMRTSTLRNIRGLGIGFEDDFGAQIMAELNPEFDRFTRVYTCPIDRDHYRKVSYETGLEFECPLHKVKLVIEDDIEIQE